ncbi:hypothetical protein ACLOJK_036163 [Asimina triloba]
MWKRQEERGIGGKRLYGIKGERGRLRLIGIRVTCSRCDDVEMSKWRAASWVRRRAWCTHAVVVTAALGGGSR